MSTVLQAPRVASSYLALRKLTPPHSGTFPHDREKNQSIHFTPVLALDVDVRCSQGESRLGIACRTSS